MDSQTTPMPQQTKQKSSPAKAFACIATIIVLMAASALVAYLWQQDRITKLNNDLANSQEKVDFLADQQSGLTQELEALSAQNAKLAKNADGTTRLVPSMSGSLEPVPAELEIKILGAMRYPDDSYSAANRTIVVDLEITNNSTQTLSFLKSDFRIIDEHNNTSVNFGALAGTTIPNGNVVLDNQSVAPGQTAKGAILFSTLGEPRGSYTLLHRTQSRQFTLQ